LLSLAPIVQTLRRLISEAAVLIGRALAPSGRGLAALGRLARTVVVLAGALVAAMLRALARVTVPLVSLVSAAAEALHPRWQAVRRAAIHAARPASRRPGVTGLIVFAIAVVVASVRNPSGGAEAALDLLVLMVLAIFLAVRALIVVTRFVTG